MSQARVLPKFIDGVKTFFVALIEDECSIYNNDVQREAEEIAKMQDNGKIDKLVSRMEEVSIPLEDEKIVVKKAKVSEEDAKRRADKVKEEKEEAKKEEQTKTRE